MEQTADFQTPASAVDLLYLLSYDRLSLLAKAISATD
jgi:hypothetical protein